MVMVMLINVGVGVGFFFFIDLLLCGFGLSVWLIEVYWNDGVMMNFGDFVEGLILDEDLELWGWKLMCWLIVLRFELMNFG